MLILRKLSKRWRGVRGGGDEIMFMPILRKFSKR